MVSFTRLDDELLGTYYSGNGACLLSCKNAVRVHVVTAGGIRIGLAGVGEGVNRLTFPAGYLIGDALRCPHAHWLQFATEEDKVQKPQQWYSQAPFKPCSLVYQDGTVALEGQTMGEKRGTVTATEQRLDQPIFDVPCVDVSKGWHTSYTVVEWTQLFVLVVRQLNAHCRPLDTACILLRLRADFCRKGHL